MIFSSGYTYIFSETSMMKNLAMSLGVPEEAITLEERAKNTYENVEFTKEILVKNNWQDILLISSPYHMLRASLVFNKVAKEIKVCYTPAPKSIFYSRRQIGSNGKKSLRQINIRQIHGILHEYMGIVYYFWKGNI